MLPVRPEADRLTVQVELQPMDGAALFSLATTAQPIAERQDGKPLAPIREVAASSFIAS
jgi:hypothetical protein